MNAEVVFYVSGHGFGHATRISALIHALHVTAQRPVAMGVRSEAPRWIFEQRTPHVTCEGAEIDIGVHQPNGLDIDLPRSLAAHEAFAAGWESAIEREARWIRKMGASLVVADVPALAFAAARRAGVRALGVANFSWDWILEAYQEVQPRWRPIVEAYRAAYETAEALFRLPLHGDLSAFPNIIDVPLLVNRARRSVAECRRAVGIPPGETRRVVLFSFGGLGSSSLEPTAKDELEDYLFVGVGPAPQGFRGDWIAVQGPGALPHEELIVACDAVIGKPGFSTAAEVLTHRRRFLFLARDHFRESPVLEQGLAHQGCARAMPRDDFSSGRWRASLDALFAQPAPPPPPPSDGAEVIAAAILKLLER